MSTEQEWKSGHCLCGAVSYEFSGPVNWCAHCHCESCRRNTASAFTTFFGVPNDAFRFTAKEPSVYASSEGVNRLFCRTCGTPVAYVSDRFPGETHFYLASLDAQSAGILPQAHVHWNEHVHWVEPADTLPRKSLDGES